MKQIVSLGLALLMNSLLNCSACIDHDKGYQKNDQPMNSNAAQTPKPKEPAGTQKLNSSERKRPDEVCDFSKYSPVRISHFVQRAALKTVMPKYPEEAIRLRIQGYVTVKIVVNRAGDVEKACVNSGDDMLRHPAEEAALQWKFKTNFGFTHVRSVDRKGDKATYVLDIIPFNYVLNESGPKIGFIVRP